MSFFSSTLRNSVHPLLPLHNSSSPAGNLPSTPNSPSPLPSPSVYRTPSARPRRDDYGTNDVLLALARQTAQLERTLQSHLDAQSAGLLAGLGRDDDDAESNLDTPSAVLRTDPLSQTTYTNAPTTTPKPLPLPRARRAIRTALLKLAETKAAEASELAAAKEPVDTFLANVESLAARKAGLDAHIEVLDGSANAENGAGQLQVLADEEQSLDAEVRALEDKLAERRARLRHVRQRRETLANRRDADLSSWRHARAEVERRIAAEVLSGRGAPDTTALRPSGYSNSSERRSESARRSVSSRRSGSGGRPAGSRPGARASSREEVDVDVWALPPSRRTLELVRSSLATAQRSAESRRAAAQAEAEACVQGADLWRGAVGAVRGVEQALAAEMARLGSGSGAPPPVDPLLRPSVSPPASLSASAALGTDATSSFATARSRPEHGASDLSGVPEEAEADAATSGMRAVLRLMQQTADALAQDMRLATRRGWAPLVCAIGAELEAMREGRQILERALGLGAPVAQTEPGMAADGGETAAKKEEGALVDTEPSVDTSKGKEKVPVLFDAEDHDEPSADLLVEHIDEPSADLLIEHDEDNDAPSSDLLFTQPGTTGHRGIEGSW